MNLKKISDEPLVFQNVKPLEKMGNVLPIAYGGLLQAHSLMAAFHSLPGELHDKDKWVVYSVTGEYVQDDLVSTVLNDE
jgi:hypothetical protein